MTQALPKPRAPWPDYAAVWRWHFYAGLFCIPFVCFLAVTGSLYLFKPQVEAWLDQPYDHLSTLQTAAPSRAVGLALAAYPGWTLHAYELPGGPQAAARVILGRDGVERRLYVDRGSLRILKSVPEDGRLMRMIFHLHGELLLGDPGSAVVELAASWAIVMIVTGIYLWWPRGAIGLAGVVYPRLTSGKRLFWRDLHAVTGVWVSAFVLLLLFSGLPWTKNWGGYLKEVRHLAGVASPHQDWTTGRADEIAQHKALDRASMAGMSPMPGMANMPGMAPAGGEHAEHAEHGRGRRDGLHLAPEALLALDWVEPTVAALDLAKPVLIAPPSRPGGSWSARSDAQNRPLRVDLTLDGASGQLLSRTNFAQRNLIDRIIGYGVAAHEGQLFGWLNQLLGVVIAIALLAISISAGVLWWSRRAAGVLGAPMPVGAPRFSAGLAAIVIMLGVLLPEFGASLIVVALVEHLVLRRLPRCRDWLGLRPA